MSIIEIKNNCLKVKINTFGAELYSIVKNNNEMLWHGDERFWNGRAPVLFPSAGSLREKRYEYDQKSYDLQPHGFARKSDFTVESITDNRAELKLVKTSEHYLVYPFEYDFYVIYEVVDSTLICTIKVVNKQEKPIYFAYGSHESYALTQDISNYSLLFEKQEDFLSHVVVDNGLINYQFDDFGKGKLLKLSKQTFLHDTIVFSSLNSRKVTLLNGEQKIAELSFDTPNLLIWTKSDAPFVCIEPWSKIPDYTDSPFEIEKKQGFIKLNKGENFVSKHEIKYF